MTELALTNKEASLVPVDYNEKEFESIASGSDHFKRLQLAGSQSDLVKDEKIKQGHFALIADKENFKDLGQGLDVLVCGFRYKAMDISGDDVISVFNTKDPEFVRIKELSKDAQSRNLCGIEFLFWIPTDKVFATFYMASKSALRAVPSIRSKMDEKNNKPGPATLGSSLVSNKRYKWHVTTVQECSTPFELPTLEQLTDNAQKFQNPPKNETETAKEPERAR